MIILSLLETEVLKRTKQILEQKNSVNKLKTAIAASIGNRSDGRMNDSKDRDLEMIQLEERTKIFKKGRNFMRAIRF